MAPQDRNRDLRVNQMYLDIMKKALSFMLWQEPGIPLDTYVYRYPFPIRFGINALSRILRLGKLQLVRDRAFPEERRTSGRIWPVLADTMIGMKRLDNLQFCVEQVILDDVPGDLIETGVWRGGASIFMRAILGAYGVTDRRVYVADSFAGLPPPDVQHFPQDKLCQFHEEKFLAASREVVENNFKRYALLDDQVVFLEGWFRETLPNAPIENLAVMRLDGDMYQSTMDALANLYPKLSEGGYCIVDDYGAMKCCRQAVQDYRIEHNIQCPLLEIDWTGVYWRKQ